MNIIFASVAVGLGQLVIAILFSVLALYIGFAVMSRLPHNIYVEKELENGNKAVGIVVFAVFIAIALVVESGISGLSGGINKALNIGIFTGDGLVVVMVSIIQLIFGVVLAVAAIYLALNLFDRLTENVEEFRELKHGNIAVALEMAGIIITVAVIIQAGVIGITTSLM